ncbi:MAG: hypothetical protein HF967_01075 [Methanosarcinales archaeon]|nr:hypothetical protein [Methanosarcinales archaeon]
MNNLNSQITKGVIIILPLTITAHEAIPYSIINGIPIGLYYYQKSNDISEILRTANNYPIFQKSELVVLAMWKEFYLNLGNKIHQTLTKGYSNKRLAVNKWFSDEVSRDELVQRLIDRKISLVIYLGHGRSRGWSGYRGLRWHHLLSKKAKSSSIGIIISMTCDNLKFEHNKIPFGLKWVLENRACSFFGAVESVKIFPMKKICNLLGNIFSEGKVDTIGGLIVLLDKEISETKNDEIKECWSKFRLIGNPLTQI